MKLTPPKQITFVISVILVLLGLLGNLGFIAAVAPYAFWLVFFGFVLLALSLMIKGL